MRHNPGYGIMTELVKRGAVPVYRLEICLRRRRLHEVVGGVVEGPRPADAEVCAGRCDQRFSLRKD